MRNNIDHKIIAVQTHIYSLNKQPTKGIKSKLNKPLTKNYYID